MLKRYFFAVLIFAFIAGGCQNKQEQASQQNQAGEQKAVPEDQRNPQLTASDTAQTKVMAIQGTIDLAAIDANKDGKVYQCAMDWNVVADHEGKCAECGMNLTEYSIADAKSNLVKNGFKVK